LHEFTTAQNILSTVLRVAADNNAKNVSEIAIEISALGHLNKDQLLFSLKILSENTIANQTRVQITEKKVKAFCKKCHHQQILKTDPEDHFKVLASLKCSKCGYTDLEIKGSTDCIVNHIKIEK
jgi:hydrogenase nickel insertion protein HypA